MNKYWALVRPVAGTTVTVYIMADNPTNAYSLFKAMYGPLLWSTCAFPMAN